MHEIPINCKSSELRHLSPAQPAFISTKLLNSHFLSQPGSQGESIQGNAKDFMHANDTGTEIQESTGNIHTTLVVLDRRKKVRMLLSAKTFSSIKSEGDTSLPEKSRSLVHLLLGHCRTAEKLQFAANPLKQIEGLGYI